MEVAGIRFAREGRAELASAAAQKLSDGDEDGALALLLCDRDDWATGEGPTEADAREAMRASTLREAMAALKYGPVGDYFAFRWSDPTFVSGLALLDAHAGGVGSMFELGCGIGHFLREAARRGIAVSGADVVFSKLWLCKRFVCPEAELVCFDAGQDPWRVGSADLALCHDALHYLPDKAGVVARLRTVAPRVAVGHAHNARVENLSPGDPLDPEGYERLFAEEPKLYSDEELAEGLIADEPAEPRDPVELGSVAAIALVSGPTRRHGGFALPVEGARLRENPLLVDGVPAWPSRHYEDEYAAQSHYLTDPAPFDPVARARRRLLLDLPERW